LTALAGYVAGYVAGSSLTVPGVAGAYEISDFCVIEYSRAMKTIRKARIETAVALMFGIAASVGSLRRLKNSIL